MFGKRSTAVTLVAVFGLAWALIPVQVRAGSGKVSAAKRSELQLERGRYLVTIAGCNDCHTAGYMLKNGKVPEAEWLTGDILGWSGPWGTTYAPNLRQVLANFTADQWVAYARTLKARPPMPWYSLNRMTEKDLRAIHALIRHLGPTGGPAPSYLPPGQEPKPPYARFLLPQP
jgi:mono/diheme cytochrome c family protein